MNTGNQQITFTVEVDKDIFHSIQEFLDSHEDWDFDRAIEAGVSLFLLQHYEDFKQLNSRGFRACNRSYVNFVSLKEEEKFNQN